MCVTPSKKAQKKLQELKDITKKIAKIAKMKGNVKRR